MVLTVFIRETPVVHETFPFESIIRATSKMSSRIFLMFALSLYVSMTSALPSDLRSLNLANGDVDSVTSNSNITTPNLLRAQTVSCLNSRKPSKPIASDCDYVLNVMILQEPNVFKERIFKHMSYMTETGRYARSRWQYFSCEVEVFGQRHASQLLSLVYVAFTVDRIVRQCVNDVIDPKGGLSLIGDLSKGFHVIVQGYGEPERSFGKNSSIPQQPTVSVSRRGLLSQHESENSAGPQSVEIRESLMRVSRVANPPDVTSNSTIGTPRPARHPVHCFNPFVAHLQPAAATDCSFIINQIILRLFDPTRELTFGFTDAADVNLSKPEYQKWQYGQCMISVKNTDVTRVDTFRLLDLATTARRITMQCLLNTQDKIGGIAHIGTEGRGFYVYVGGPLASSSTLTDVMLFRESTGVDSS